MALPSDMPAAKKEQVAVFFDYENTRRNAIDAFRDRSCPSYLGTFDPVGLAEDLCAMRKRPSTLSKVFVYRGRPVPERQPKPRSWFDKLHESWSKSPLYEMKSRDLKYRLFDDGTFQAQEKGIDVWLATDLIAFSIKQLFDAVIVVSTDTDLIPAIEFVLRETKQHIEVACWEARNIYPLAIPSKDGRRIPYCHYLGKEMFTKHCEDEEAR